MKDKVIDALKEYLDYLYDRFNLYKSNNKLRTYYCGKIDCAREVMEIIGNINLDNVKNNKS